jgi:DNA invertase Pin-like site-specific DNA recombinase
MGTTTYEPFRLDLDDLVPTGTTLFDSRPEHLRTALIHDPIPVAWLGYIRKSVVRNAAQEIGLDRQQAAIEAKVAPHGEVERWFKDMDRSASRYAKYPRPDFDALVELVASGEAKGKGIIAWDQDRLIRRPSELETLLIACETGRVSHLWSTAGDIDLNYSGQVTLARIKAAIAAEESEKTSRRVKLMHDDYGNEGMWTGGIVPYGYRTTKAKMNDTKGHERWVTRLEVEPAEALAITEAARRVLDGETLMSILSDFDERGIPTRKGGKWHAATLRGILVGPTAAGIRVHRPRRPDGSFDGEHHVRAEWPAIIDETTHRRLVAFLTNPDRDRRAIRSNKPAYLLSGLCECAQCGSKMYSKPSVHNGGGHYTKRAYSDKHGYCVTIQGEKLEEQVVGELFARLDQKRQETSHADRSVGTATAEIEAQLDVIRERRRALTEARYAPDPGVGPMDADDFLFAKGKLDRQEAELVAQMEPLQHAAEVDQARWNLQERWEGMTLVERREAIVLFIDKVVVAKATKRGMNYDPSRVKVTFRF